MERKQLEHLLRTHHEDAYLWSLRCCHTDTEHAKDVLQLVYLKILEGRAKYGRQSSFKSWLYSVIRFTAIDQFRRRKNFEQLNGMEVQVETDAYERDYYRNLLRQLPDRQQEILLLYFYHDLTLEEIAQILEIHVGTVRTHYARGKEAIRKTLKKEEINE